MTATYEDDAGRVKTLLGWLYDCAVNAAPLDSRVEAEIRHVLGLDDQANPFAGTGGEQT